MTATRGRDSDGWRAPHWIVLGTVAFAIAIALTVWLSTRDRWERRNGTQVAGLLEVADAHARAGRLEQAANTYDELMRLVGSRQLRDPALVTAVAQARERHRQTQDRIAQALTHQQNRQRAEAERARRSLQQEQENARRREADRLAASAMAAREAEARRELTPEEITARSDRSVAMIKHARGGGTGFVAAPGVLVTNHHVVCDVPLEQLEVHFPSGGEKRAFRALRVLDLDAARDLAVLSIDEDAAPPLPIVPHYQFRRGQTITVIGSPGVTDKLTLENAVSVGVMSTQVTVKDVDMYQMSIAVNPGNSGGPVFDSTGKVVGVVVLKATGKESIAFCIPLPHLRESLARAGGRSLADAAKLTSRHDMQVLLRRSAFLGNWYLLMMETYTTAMDASIKGGLSADVGLSMMQTEYRKHADDPAFDTADVLPVLRRVGSDESVPEATRSKLIELWTTCAEMKSYVERPRGSYLSYREKTHQLRDQHARLVEALKLLLGVEDLGTLSD